MIRLRPFALMMVLLAWPAVHAHADVPPWLPRYDLDIHLDTNQRVAKVVEKVTWTNRTEKAVKQIVFNAHARYTIPDDQIGFLAKMLEILRMAPSEALSFDGPALDIQKISVTELVAKDSSKILQAGFRNAELAPQYAPDNPTALVVPLPQEVGPGESVTLELALTVRIPPKKGRWGQWAGVTTLAQWLPVVAVLDDNGWQPAPFIPWHQPFHNEAGVYSARVTIPSEQKLASSGFIKETIDLGDGWVQHVIEPTPLRDFAMIACARFQEHIGQAGETRVRVLCLPEHEWYGKEIVKIVEEALPVYNRWFGPFPYPQFTVVEAYFGWNGNECGDLVMIDYRMMGMPHLAKAYVDYLVSHELCHQWWYNVVGTNGYAETWMDEGLATYFSHRLVNEKVGKDNKLLQFPRGLEWLPNITRDDFRNYGLIGARARGETEHATVQEMPKFKNLVNLSAYTYDRGSKIVGMIEERMGEAAFLDFIRHIYASYQFRILRVADFQRELETFTGRSWDDFFRHWVHSGGMCDWSVERAEVVSSAPRLLGRRGKTKDKVVVTLRQQGQFNEPTVLGFQFGGPGGHQLRVPIIPDAPVLRLEDPECTVECSIENNQCLVRVELCTSETPTQITVDPDRILLDAKPTNNHWKPEIRWRLTPLYTAIEEADVTNAYDRWNVIAGPWVYGSAYTNPWFQRTPLFGLKASVFRTQEFMAGAFVAYRSNDRNIIAGVDAVWDHVPLPNTQIGLVVEKSILTAGADDIPASRGVIYGRYVILPSSSLYLPPFEYVDVFGTIMDRCLPKPRITSPGADLFTDRTALGIHYHKNYMTPYWDAEGGIALDVSYQYGLPIFGADQDFHQVAGQFSTVKRMPNLKFLGDGPVLDWLRSTRWAFRIGGAAALPDHGQFFALGGGDMFRGFDLEERQGSLSWVGSIEWRLPIFTDLNWDVCDHLAGIRNIYLAPFYDVGDAYLQGHSLGSVAHCVGVGVRVDVAWIGLIERTILRFDAAQTLGGGYPTQFWFGVQHPF